MFVGGDTFDFHLQPGSPCIDAGDPDSPLDPDGSRADMGAFSTAAPLTSSISILSIYGENGQYVSIPLYATGIAGQQISGIEFHITRSPDCLEFDEFTSDYLTNPIVNDLDGTVNILWEDFQNPVSFPDSAVIGEPHFWVLGQIGDTCAVEWTGNNELVDQSGEIIPGVGWNNGRVTVIEFHSVSGNVIYYDMLTPVPGVEARLSGDYTAVDTTDDNGNFSYATLFPGSFAICPARPDDDPGVTVTDIVNIRRHIVRIEEFDSPYKLLAADVNRSGNISVADVIKLRRYLAQIEDLPSGNWAFVDSSFAVTDDNWPEAPNCLQFELWDTDLADSSFIGVRMGDVDYSWTEGRRRNPSPKTAGIAELEIHDQYAAPGENIELAITATGLDDVAGFETHIAYPSEFLRLIEIKSDYFQQPTVNSLDGVAHLIWDDVLSPVSLADGEIATSIIFQVLDSAADSIPVAFLSAHCANSNGVDYTLELHDGYVLPYQTPGQDTDNSLPLTFRLGQNYPNPFNAATTIEFDLPVNANISLGVFDMLGREIETLATGEYQPGHHRIVWDASEQPSGVYFIRLKSDQYDAVRKTVLLR